MATAQESYDANPNYNFEYAVSDPVTGDQKSQAESRSGDSVTGYYQLLEPDGTYRTVNYVADPVGGFRATVSKSGSPQVKAAPVAIVPKPAPAPLPVIQPARILPAPLPVPKAAPIVATAPIVPAPSYNYPYYQAYPYSSYPYYQNYYSGYYNPYYSGYYPYYNNYKK